MRHCMHPGVTFIIRLYYTTSVTITFFSRFGYSDATEEFTRHEQRIQEVNACLYHHWLLTYPLKCASALPEGAYFIGYFNMQQARMIEGKLLA